MTGPAEQSTTKPEPAPASTLPALPELPTMPRGTGGSSETGYSPLSLLALAALCLAMAYAITVTVGGLMALAGGGPLLLPMWSFGVPILALVLALFARYRIKVSEGTLSGQGLANWAMRITLVFGLAYTANYLATYLAITSQARDRANKWLEAMTDKDIDQGAEKAFWLTLPDSERTGKRQDLELLHNTPGGPNPGAVGMFSAFQGADFVRLMALGGAETHIDYRGVDDWGYENGGFLVKLRYDIKTPQASFTLVVGVQGVVGRNRDKAGRQWSISQNPTATHLEKDVDYTAAGIDMIEKGESAKAFARSFVQIAKDYGLSSPGTYFMTLPPDKVVSQMRAARNMVFLQEKETWLPFLRDMKSYHQGGLIRGSDARLEGDKEPVFWALEDQKKAIVAAVKDQFDPVRAAKMSNKLELRAAKIPDLRYERGATRARVDVRMTVDQAPPSPPYLVDARLILLATEDKNHPWYVESIELVRARKPDMPGPRSQGPGM